jgi:hypothetical protein
MSQAANIAILLVCDVFKTNRSLYKHTFCAQILLNGILKLIFYCLLRKVSTFMAALPVSLLMLAFVAGLFPLGLDRPGKSR